MPDTLLSLLAIALYAIFGLYFWRTRWHADTARLRLPPLVEKLLLPVPLCLHALVLQQSLLSPAGLQLGVGNAISAITWLTVLIYWLANFRYPLEGLQAPVLAIATLFSLFPLLLPERGVLPNAGSPAFVAHMLVAILAYSLFTIAALHAGLMWIFERRLHGKGRATSGLGQFPPLLTMEQLLFTLLWGGFVLLTLALASGILFSEELFGKPFHFSHFTSHKTVFALLSWLTFGILLGGRQIYGWRGRIAIRWTLIGFSMLFLAYIGSKFVLEVLLHR